MRVGNSSYHHATFIAVLVSLLLHFGLLWMFLKTPEPQPAKTNLVEFGTAAPSLDARVADAPRSGTRAPAPQTSTAEVGERRKTAPDVLDNATQVRPSNRVSVLNSTPEKDKVASNTAGTGADSAASPIGEASGTKLSEADRYIYELRRFIDLRKTYPSLARKMRQEGQVIVRFEVLRDGKFTNIELTTPSQHERLNAAARELIASVNVYKPLPVSIASERLLVTVPLTYSLR
jgi:periplasmic protein TonB